VIVITKQRHLWRVVLWARRGCRRRATCSRECADFSQWRIPGFCAQPQFAGAKWKPSSKYPDRSQQDGTFRFVACCASYNAELLKQLSSNMVSVLKAKFPVSG